MSRITPLRTSPLGEHLSETARYVERLRRACAETQQLCLRQREMLDAQRRFLVELNEQRDATAAPPPAGGPPDSHGEPVGHASAGD